MMPAALLDPYVTIPLLAILGLVFGSFGNVIVMRMPEDESINGRSHCPHCHRTLTPIELIPLISFLIQMRRCRGCGVVISWQYPLVEIAGMILFVGAGALASFAFFPSFALALALWSMLVIGIIDARTQMIPDVLTGVLAVAALAYHLLLGDVIWTGALLGLVFFGAQWLLSRGRWVGSGDILLAMALGLLLGSWQHVIIMLMVAYIVGALLVSVLLGLGHMTRTQNIAFGPFLVIGALVTLLFGDQILSVVVPMY
jgi:prepilin signal peptidase PulO-like enzyme (type II secretory pathway)